MTHDVIVAMSVLGVIGQVAGAVLVLVGLLWLAGLGAPPRLLQRWIWGYELCRGRSERHDDPRRKDGGTVRQVSLSSPSHALRAFRVGAAYDGR